MQGLAATAASRATFGQASVWPMAVALLRLQGDRGKPRREAKRPPRPRRW